MRRAICWRRCCAETALLPEIWPEPLPVVIAYLTQNRGWIEVRRNLPDGELIQRRYRKPFVVTEEV